MGDSLRVLRTFPAPVQDEVGYALFLAQRGEKHESAKPLDIAATRFAPSTPCGLASGVFVLHAFQKKSKRGVTTPQAELDIAHDYPLFDAASVEELEYLILTLDQEGLLEFQPMPKGYRITRAGWEELEPVAGAGRAACR